MGKFPGGGGGTPRLGPLQFLLFLPLCLLLPHWGGQVTAAQALSLRQGSDAAEGTQVYPRTLHHNGSGVRKRLEIQRPESPSQLLFQLTALVSLGKSVLSQGTSHNVKWEGEYFMLNGFLYGVWEASGGTLSRGFHGS